MEGDDLLCYRQSFSAQEAVLGAGAVLEKANRGTDYGTDGGRSATMPARSGARLTGNISRREGCHAGSIRKRLPGDNTQGERLRAADEAVGQELRRLCQRAAALPRPDEPQQRAEDDNALSMPRPQ